MIADPGWSPTAGLFPNVLNWIDASPSLVTFFLLCLTCSAFLFSLRLWAPRCLSLFLWYGWACLLNRNIFISNPGIPYVGLLLLAFSLITLTKTTTTTTTTTKRDTDDVDEPKAQVLGEEVNPHVFPWLYWGGWTLYALGYTISGLHKLQSPSWIDGSALHHVLQSPLSRDNALCRFLLQSNPLILQVSTWMSLAAEITFLPLGLFYHTRKFYWLAFLSLHLGVLLVVNFTDLTLGVLAMHFFLLDSRWFF